MVQKIIFDEINYDLINDLLKLINIKVEEFRDKKIDYGLMIVKLQMLMQQ